MKVTLKGATGAGVAVAVAIGAGVTVAVRVGVAVGVGVWVGELIVILSPWSVMVIFWPFKLRVKC